MRRVRRAEGHQPGCVFPDRLLKGIREHPCGGTRPALPCMDMESHPVPDERRTDFNGCCHDMPLRYLVRAHARSW